MKRICVFLVLLASGLACAMLSCRTSDITVQDDGTRTEESQSAESTSLGGRKLYASSLGNFDPMQLPDIMAMQISFKKLTGRNLTKNFLIPRTNKVEMHFRDNINALCLILPESTRHAIIDSANQFIEDQAAGTIKDEKATEKNAYAVARCDLWWGAASPVNGAEGIKLCVNSKYVDGRPYLAVRVPSAASTSDNTLHSPYMELYFSPAQARDFCDVLDQEYLSGLVQQLIDKATAY